MINRHDLTSTVCDVQLNSRLSIPMWMPEAQISCRSRINVSKSKGQAPADKRTRQWASPWRNL